MPYLFKFSTWCDLRSVWRQSLPSALLLLVCLSASPARAEALRPTSDADVVEMLPSAGSSRTQEREMRQRWAAQPGDAALAVALSRRYLDQAREQGDPRFAGRALAVLQHWPDMDRAPTDVVMMSATLQQYLHDFEGSALKLEHLLTREPRHAQAWLTLATIRRVQGRYQQSDAACASLTAAGAVFYGRACEAENLGLRGQFDAARRMLDTLLATPQLPAGSRAWLLTTLAELETRAGRRTQAEKSYRAALAAQADEYARLSYADFLLENGRPAEVVPLLKNQPRSDALLLRLAMAGAVAPTPQAAADIAELRERMLQAALRPLSQTTHAREQALFAWRIEGDNEKALQLARINVQLQREPIDMLLLAEIARAAKNEQALQEARQIRTGMGLRDERLDALL